MTTSMPSGDGTVTDGPTRSAVDEEAAPTTGLEPDTAADAAGETDASPAVATPEVDPDTRPETGSAGPAAGDEEPSGAATNVAGASADRTVLDGPALENEEMHRATEDLRSSQNKTAAAREIADRLASTTQPGDG
jgi:hypothetical protein